MLSSSILSLDLDLRITWKAFSLGTVFSALNPTINKLHQSSRLRVPPSQLPPPDHGMFMWGGRFHLVPEDFAFPHGGSLLAFQHYCRGDDAKGYPPYRRLQPLDMSSKNLRRRLSDFKFLMGMMEMELMAKSNWIESPTLEEVNQMYDIALPVFSVTIPSHTQGARKRRKAHFKWTTMVHLVRAYYKTSSAHSAQEHAPDHIEDHSASVDVDDDDE
jgi:hypothetical protein